MAKKLFLDPYAFSDPESARDLYSNAIRKSLGYGVPFLEDNNYVAKVISPPLPLKPGDAAIFNNPETLLRGGNVGEETAEFVGGMRPQPGVLSKFVFYGRIEKIHAPFLEEPCPIAYAVDAAQSYNLIMQHTQFHSLATTTELPAVGDLVNVRLNKGDHGWDLQYGHYVGIYERSTDTIVPSHLPVTAKAAAAAAAGGASSLGNADAAPGFSGDYTPPENAAPVSNGAILAGAGPAANPDLLTTYWDWISRLLPEGSICTSGLRSQARQNRIIRNFYKGAWATGQPGDSFTTPPGPETDEEITYAHGQVRKKPWPGKIVGRRVSADPHGHGGGGALDISFPRLQPDPLPNGKRGTPNLGKLMEIRAVVEAASENPNIKVSTRPFHKGNYPSLYEKANNCIHVEINIDGTESFDEVSFERGRVAIVAKLGGSSATAEFVGGHVNGIMYTDRDEHAAAQAAARDAFDEARAARLAALL